MLEGRVLENLVGQGGWTAARHAVSPSGMHCLVSPAVLPTGNSAREGVGVGELTGAAATKR